MKSRCVLCAHAFSHHREIKDPELRRAFPQHTPSSLPSDWLTFPRNSTLQRGSSSRKMVVHNASERENTVTRPLDRLWRWKKITTVPPPFSFLRSPFFPNAVLEFLRRRAACRWMGGLFVAGLFLYKRQSSTGHILKSLSKRVLDFFLSQHEMTCLRNWPISESSLGGNQGEKELFWAQ